MNKLISGNIRICGVIGDPIEHTMSPTMFNAAFIECRLPYIYVPFHVKKDDLSRAINGMRALNILGLNITIPHKIAIMDLLDEVDPVAQKIGAVNTVVNTKGKLKGYNTDASGFMKVLEEQKIVVKDKIVAILGAGGASRAISFALSDAGAKLLILNRTLKKAKECADAVSQYSHAKATALELNERSIAEAIKSSDILVNTTSLGMHPDIEATPVPADLINSSLIVVDIVYNPIRTKFLRLAREAGCRVVPGIEMLAWQGALSFEKWTEQEAPIKKMRQAVIKELKKHEN